MRKAIFPTIVALLVSAPILAAVAPPRLTNPGAWLQRREAPFGSLNQGERALTALDLVIDPSGSVVTCNIALSSNSAALDQYACALFKQNAHYEPAPATGDTETLRTRMIGPHRVVRFDC
jgi:outer membrane biosynthesis protein TonB